MVDKFFEETTWKLWQKLMIMLLSGSATVILFLIGLGVNSIRGDITRIEVNQLKYQEKMAEAQKEHRKEILESQDRQDTLMKAMCNQLKEHEDWLRVPFEARQRYFFNNLLKGK
jgi:hypothetical protein